jgi:hypothetical protein
MNYGEESRDSLGFLKNNISYNDSNQKLLGRDTKK